MTHPRILLAAVLFASPGQLARAAESVSQWDFGGSLASSTAHPEITPGFSPPATAPGVTFESVPLRGVPSTVARLTRGTYLAIPAVLASSGGGQKVNQYTLVLDVQFPDRSASGGWAALLQADPGNGDDADWFVHPAGGIGINGIYNGSVPEGEWRRLALVVDLVRGQVASFLDGVEVGRLTGQARDGRFALTPSGGPGAVAALLFADNDAETSACLIAGAQLRGSALCPEDVAALGRFEERPLDSTPIAAHTCAAPFLTIKEGPYLQWATTSEISVLWETNGLTDSTVLVRRAGGDWQEVSGPASVRIHEVRLSGFEAGETAEYRVRSRAAGVELVSDIFTFTTNPPGAPDFSFVVWGDNQANPPIFTRLVQGMTSLSPNLAVSCGDVVDDGNDYARWGTEFLTPLRPLGRSVPFYVAIGNHERNAHWFYDYLAQPGNEHWFSFDYAGCHFTIIDSNFPFGPGTEQYDWILSDLFSQAAQQAKWLFVFHHHPPYSEIYEEVVYDRLRKQLVPLFEAAGVDVDFTGHIHDYERGIYTPPDTGRRITYVQTSGGGGRLWDDEFDGDYEQITKVIQYVYHYCDLRISGNTLTLRAIDLDGNEIDTFTLSQLPRNGEPPPPPPPPPPPGEVTITQWDFEDGTLAASFGPGRLDYLDGEGGLTARQAKIASSVQLGTPLIGGVSSGLLKFPKTTSTSGFRLTHGASANGGGFRVNEYSLVLDLLIPASSYLTDPWLSVLNTSTSNADDGDVFIKLPAGGVGISSVYEGTLVRNRWHRLALVFAVNDSFVTLRKFIDGQLVGTQEVGAVDDRWSLQATGDEQPHFLLFTDDNGETSTGYVSSLLFVSRALSAAEVQGLGSPAAAGILSGPCLGVQCDGLFRRGDANVDGIVDLADPLHMLFVLFVDGRSPLCERSFDTNDDGRLDVSDVVATLEYLFRGGPPPAAPFPWCGEDPTADALTCSGEGSCK